MAQDSNSTNSPISIEQLTGIATEACDSTLDGVKEYDHEQVSQWSSEIINKVLQAVIQTDASSETTDKPDLTSSQPTYRFNVTCTIIQQGLSDSNGSVESAGKRGMHCASGSYWDAQRDGMWTYKYPNTDDKGLDLVVNVAWFGSLK